jgi:hypothetical protein
MIAADDSIPFSCSTTIPTVGQTAQQLLLCPDCSSDAVKTCLDACSKCILDESLPNCASTQCNLCQQTSFACLETVSVSAITSANPEDVDTGAIRSDVVMLIMAASATDLVISTENVGVTVTSGSALISVIILVPSDTDAVTIKAAAESNVGTAQQASQFFGVPVATPPTITSSQDFKDDPSWPSDDDGGGGAGGDDDGSGGGVSIGIIAGAAGGGAALLIGVGLAIYCQRSKKMAQPKVAQPKVAQKVSEV